MWRNDQALSPEVVAYGVAICHSSRMVVVSGEASRAVFPCPVVLRTLPRPDPCRCATSLLLLQPHVHSPHLRSRADLSFRNRQERNRTVHVSVDSALPL
jgi:hypothetical protein